MKKTYIIPQTKVILLEPEPLLAGSPLPDSVSFTFSDSEEEGFAD